MASEHAEISALLADSLAPEGVRWHSPVRYLGGRRPIDVLPTDPGRVRQAAEAYIEGTYC